LVEMKSNKSDRIILKLPREQALTFSLVWFPYWCCYGNS
jgi:hypothetical protein